jgi:DNA primase
LHDFEATKEEIRQRIDLVEVVGEHVSLKRSGNSFSGLCPFHTEKTPSFHVIPSKMIFHCFGCKAGGDVFKFVQLREGVTFGESVRILADRAGIELRSRRPSASGAPGRTDLARANAWAADFYRKQLLDPQAGQSARRYVEGRGISAQTAERFQLGLADDVPGTLQKAAALAGIPDSLLRAAGLIRSDDGGSSYETFRHRLMFPIRDATKRVVGFGGRALGEAKAKYLNTPQNDLFDKGRLLYGLDLARTDISATGRSIVVEGYTDCIACHQAGFSSAVATLGTAMTESQANLLRRYGHQIILVFDSDAAGDAAAERALAVALRLGLTVRLASVPTGKDPCDFLGTHGPEAFESLLSSATEALRFSWERTRARFDSGGADAGRREAILEFVRLVAGLTRTGAVDAIQQGLIANQVAELLNIGPDQAHRLFNQATRPQRREPADSPSGADQPGGERPTATAEQSALTAILEVLLNEPGLHRIAQAVFSPRLFRDPTLRRVAEAVDLLARELGESTLVEVLDRLPDPHDAQRATELHIRGDARGNFAATLTGAVDYLERIAAARRASKLGRQGPGPADEGKTEQRSGAARWNAIQAVLHEPTPCVPRSKLTAVRDGDL